MKLSIQFNYTSDTPPLYIWLSRIFNIKYPTIRSEPSILSEYISVNKIKSPLVSKIATDRPRHLMI